MLSKLKMEFFYRFDTWLVIQSEERRRSGRLTTKTETTALGLKRRFRGLHYPKRHSAA